MEDFKKEIWEKDHLDLEYSPLDCSSIKNILYNIENQYKISISSNSSFFKEISMVFKNKLILHEINDSTGFENLIYLLNLDIQPKTIINVIWDYNEVDQFESATLKNYWDYIWYGPSDEVCLLDFPSHNLLVMITDYGTIYL